MPSSRQGRRTISSSLETTVGQDCSHPADLDRRVNLAGAGPAALGMGCTRRLDANV